MASSSLIIRTAILCFVVCTQITASSAATVPRKYTDYIITKCRATTYASLCIKTLTPYAASIKTNPLYLCNVALNVAIQSAKKASASVKNLVSQKQGITRTEAAIIKECIGDIKDVIYELKDAMNAMAHLGDPDRDFQWSNAKTRASAAITDAETCKDGFFERKVNPVVKKKIGAYISALEKQIGSALSLINHLY